MCIIIDTCALAGVFEPSSEKHEAFKPVLEWIVFGKGKIVYGGTKYKEELRKAIKYLKILLEFKKGGKLKEIDCNSVDRFEKTIKSHVQNACNDPHLIAIVSASGCRIICTLDIKSFKYLQKSDLYPVGIKKPKIYQNTTHKKLLVDENIATVCKPALKGGKELAKILKN